MGIIEGKYPAEGNTFMCEGRKFVIKERKQPKDKPKHYLIMLTPFQYVSSLFPVVGEEQVYHFDFERELYRLRLKAGIVELGKVEQVDL